MLNNEEKVLKDKIKCYTKDLIRLLKILGFNGIEDCNGLRYNEIRLLSNVGCKFYLRVRFQILEDGKYSLYLVDYLCDLANPNAICQFLSILNTLMCFENLGLFNVYDTESSLGVLVNNPIINNMLLNLGFYYSEYIFSTYCKEYL